MYFVKRWKYTIDPYMGLADENYEENEYQGEDMQMIQKDELRNRQNWGVIQESIGVI